MRQDKSRKVRLGATQDLSYSAFCGYPVPLRSHLAPDLPPHSLAALARATVGRALDSHSPNPRPDRSSAD